MTLLYSCAVQRVPPLLWVEHGDQPQAAPLVRITVKPVDDPLVALNETMVTSVGTAVELIVPVTDVDGDTSAIVQPSPSIHFWAEDQ